MKLKTSSIGPPTSMEPGPPMQLRLQNGKLIDRVRWLILRCQLLRHIRRKIFLVLCLEDPSGFVFGGPVGGPELRWTLGWTRRKIFLGLCRWTRRKIFLVLCLWTQRKICLVVCRWTRRKICLVLCRWTRRKICFFKLSRVKV